LAKKIAIFHQYLAYVENDTNAHIVTVEN